jgi:hypothetical protein
MNTPEHAGEILVQLTSGTVTPPAGRVYASLVRGKLAYPAPSQLAQDPAARDELWRRSAELSGLAIHRSTGRITSCRASCARSAWVFGC